MRTVALLTREIITMCVFAGFTTWCVNERLTWDFAWASLCVVGAASFMFRGNPFLVR